MMRAVITMTDPLNRLLHDAAGQRPDPEPSRRAIRATLGQGIARQRRRDARARVTRTAAIAVALVAVLCGPLGSDDFEISVKTEQKADFRASTYSQGLRGDEFAMVEGKSEAFVEELAQQRAADEGILIGLSGYQVGPNRHFTYAVEFIVDGKFISEGRPLPGESDKVPAWFKLYLGSDVGAVFAITSESWKTQAPDTTFPMRIGDLQWIVKGWRNRIPGKEELIYYRGERADGVRSKDKEGF
jgi:hypothetical protein